MVGDINAIFVYGTLKKGLSNHYIIQNKFERCENAYVYGKLFDCAENFPALIWGKEKIHGELYFFKDMDSILKEIDPIEGYYDEENEKNLYDRVTIDAFLENGEKINCYTYVFHNIELLFFNEKFVYIPEGVWQE